MFSSQIYPCFDMQGRAHIDIKGGFSPCPFTPSVKQLPFISDHESSIYYMVKEMQNAFPCLLVDLPNTLD